MIVNREELKKNSKAKLGVPEQPHMRILRNYKPSPMQRRARLFGNIIGIGMLVALLFGAAYLLYTLVIIGSNIAERKIEEIEREENAAADPATAPADPAEQVQIIFTPSSPSE